MIMTAFAWFGILVACMLFVAGLISLVSKGYNIITTIKLLCNLPQKLDSERESRWALETRHSTQILKLEYKVKMLETQVARIGKEGK